MEWIVVNEYIMTSPLGLVDIYSAGNTSPAKESNVWYHTTLNSGITAKISGETDFPCVSGERIGYARSYFKLDKNVGLSYIEFLKAILEGRDYVSDGFLI